MPSEYRSAGKYENYIIKQLWNIVVHVYRRSKVSVQNSKAGLHDESRHNFKVMYMHQLGHFASLLSILLFNRF